MSDLPHPVVLELRAAELIATTTVHRGEAELCECC